MVTLVLAACVMPPVLLNKMAAPACVLRKLASMLISPPYTDTGPFTLKARLRFSVAVLPGAPN